MPNPLIPAVDAAAVPGLFHILLVLTFVLHLGFMNLTLGGTLLAAISQLASKGAADDPRTILAARLMGINNYGISLTITTGVAPLLFVQVLYQQYFYPATILLGWIWFLFLVMLAVGYYAAYAYKFRGVPSVGRGGTVWLILSAVMFFLIAMVQVAVNLVHSRPDHWSVLASQPPSCFRSSTASCSSWYSPETSSKASCGAASQPWRRWESPFWSPSGWPCCSPGFAIPSKNSELSTSLSDWLPR